jgi:uncharacterized protein YkwD
LDPSRPLAGFQPEAPWTALAVGIAAAIALALALLSPSPAAAAGGSSERARGCPYARTLPAKATNKQSRIAIRCLVNRRRAAHGMGDLKVSKRLRKAASGHSRAMVRYDFFSHYSLSGRTFERRIRLAGYLAGARSWRVGEVIAAGTGRRGTARSIVKAWMQSPGHREQILTRGYRHLGVGVADGFPGGGRRGATYTIDFGVRG